MKNNESTQKTLNKFNDYAIHKKKLENEAYKSQASWSMFRKRMKKYNRLIVRFATFNNKKENMRTRLKENILSSLEVSTHKQSHNI